MGEKKLKKEIIERIWKLRDLIKDLEVIKDKIVDLLRIEQDLDESIKKVWITDVKECYYRIIGAWELLRAGIDGKVKYLESSKIFVSAGKSRLTQFFSELKTFDNEKAERLIINAKEIFDKLIQAFQNEFDLLTPKKIIEKPLEPIKKISEKNYQLTCSICGEISVIFTIGKGTLDKDEKLIFNGITHSTSLGKELAEELFMTLKTKDLSKVHDFMKKYHSNEGLDAYCPECDKVYCWEHYNAEEVFDIGFYDCTYGICPKGHRRIIDD
ncbi:MAG: hypothetical protein GF383_08105 [Candidatus Lokiarchaeota archaeon]|nr:hypothetical protein [Candidatus Lokiarchaeota archaeon]MBD3340294.1 hypothetical protein [Candidatus Lokiarchaeota archaeon]